MLMQQRTVSYKFINDFITNEIYEEINDYAIKDSKIEGNQWMNNKWKLAMRKSMIM